MKIDILSYSTLKREIAKRRRSKIEAFRERNVRLVHGNSASGWTDVELLSIPYYASPKISIIIPYFNEARLTFECILSIVMSSPSVSYEIILADDCSDELDAKKLNQIKNVRYFCNERNIGFLATCNAAYRYAVGEFVFLLNNDTQVTAGAIDELYYALMSDPNVVGVGPMILYPNGRLQEAGCRIREDGSTVMLGLFEDPAQPEFEWSREVDYCSGAAFMFRRFATKELFDPEFIPAYCEDVDLCLRLTLDSKMIKYVPASRVIHHLSVSTAKSSEIKRRQLAARNQHKLLCKWGPRLQEENHVRVIAFYLPQFHPIPENDFWWGKGFTEWRNAIRAKPCYTGHYQPHLPADLGFYDLRTPQVLGEQYQLARRYGIHGFCVYYYNFGGKPLLQTPIENLLANPQIEFPFCLCWANESWTRNWDGGTRDVIMAQDYTNSGIQSVVMDMSRYMKDHRYIKVRGKPLFAIYRPMAIPDILDTVAFIREAAAAHGIPQIHLVYVEAMEAANRNINPRDMGFDASIQFPPQGIAVRSNNDVELMNGDWQGTRYDFLETALNDVEKSRPRYPRYPGAFFQWDNTARQPVSSDCFDKTSPEAFQAYFEAKVEITRDFLPPGQRFIFVNAWNEWAEGAHLEPDLSYGHRWLQALRDGVACVG